MKTDFLAIHERIKNSIHHAISDEAEDWSIMPSDIANEIDHGFLAYAEGLEEQCELLQTEQTAFVQTQTEVLNSHVMNEHLHLTSFQTEAIDKVPQKLDRTDFEAHLQDDARHLTFSDKDTLSQVSQKLDREEFEKHAGNYSAHLSHWQSQQIEDSFKFRNRVASVSEATEAGTYLVQSTAEDLPEDLLGKMSDYTLRVYDYAHSDELSKFERSINQFLDVLEIGKEGYTCYVRQGFLEKTEPETPEVAETAENPEILPEVEETQAPTYWFSPWQVQSTTPTETPTPTKHQASVFLCEDTSNGKAINSAYFHSFCYVGNGQIVYVSIEDNWKLYLKNINDTSNGMAINSVSSSFPCYVGNGQIVYSNGHGGKLYLKNINDTSDGTAINSVSSSFSCYVGNGQIVYYNNDDGYKLYLKNINDTSDGTAINSVSSSFPCYVGNRQIVYTNLNDNFKLYLKSINDTSDGNAINSVHSDYPCYVGNGQIVYSNAYAGKLYLKNINDTSEGVAINSVFSAIPCYVGNGQIVYCNNNDDGWKLYLKNLYEYI
jgi:hypothetical protein